MTTKEDMKELALLSKLYLSEDELSNFRKDFDSLIDFIRVVGDVECESGFISVSGVSYSHREDQVAESYPCDEILKNAPCKDGDSFILKKRS